jgi:hypothetical protein
MKNSNLIAALAGVALAAHSASASFTPGSVVVLRVGDGSVAFDSNYLAQPIYLDEYSTGGGALASHAVPSSGAGAALLTSRNDDHDGHLNLSDNGQFLTFGAYRTTSGGSYAVSAASASVPRVLGMVDSNWSINTSTALTDAYNGATINAVATDDGSRFWTAGNSGNTSAPTSGGLRYVSSLGATASVNVSQTQAVGGSLAPDAMRNARINNGQLYINTASQGSFTNRGVYKTSTALPAFATNTPVPVTGVITNREGQSTDANGNADPDTKGKLHPKSDAVFVDLSSDGVYDVAYSTGGKDELEKWSFSTGAWLRSDLLYLPSGEEINALGYYLDGAEINVFASTDGGLYRFDDSGAAAGIVSPTVAEPNFENKRYLTSAYFIQADAGTQFRGFAVIVPEPTSVVFALIALPSCVRRRR